MKTFNVKYGFWTTYDQTVFLKQERIEKGRWVLRVSNIIKSRAESNLMLRADENLTDSVSLRECMLFLICATNGPDSDVYVHKDDEGFIRDDSSKSAESEVSLRRKTAKKLLPEAGPSPGEIEALKKAEAARSREERAARRERTGQSLGTLPERSRERSAQRHLPAHQPADPRRSELRSSSKSSSTSSMRQASSNIKGLAEPKPRSTSAERGRSSKRDPSEVGHGEVPRGTSANKKAPPSAEAQGKQKAKATTSSRERSAQGGARQAGGQEMLRERSSSSHRRARQLAQDLEEDDDPYGVSVQERQLASIGYPRASQDAPPPVPPVPHLPAGESTPPRPSAGMIGSSTSAEGQRSPVSRLWRRATNRDKKDKKSGKGRK
jgi:hypothetical protein